jgi:hypothetical protein
MAASIKLVQNDTSPPFRAQLTERATGLTIDVSTATAIYLYFQAEGTTPIIDTLTATKLAGKLRANGTTDPNPTTPGAGGLVQFTFSPTTLAQTPGYYTGQIEIHWADSTVQTVYDHLRFYIRAR